MENKSGNITFIESDERFEKIPNTLLDDIENIDPMSVAIYCRIRRLAKKWKLNIKGLSVHLKLTDEKIRKAIVILEKEGYIGRYAVKDINSGKFLGWDYSIYMYPLPLNNRTSAGRKKQSINTDITEHGVVGSPTCGKTDLSAKGEENNTKTELNINTESNIINSKKYISSVGEKIQLWWKEYNPNLEQPKFWSKKRDGYVKSLMLDTNATEEDLKKAVMLIGCSSLCQGKGKQIEGKKTVFKMDVDYLLKNVNNCFCKLFDGKYHWSNQEKDAYNKIMNGEEVAKIEIKEPKQPISGGWVFDE